MNICALQKEKMKPDSCKRSAILLDDSPDLNEFKRENSEIGENDQDFYGRIKSSDSKELSLSYENGERNEEKYILCKLSEPRVSKNIQ